MSKLDNRSVSNCSTTICMYMLFARSELLHKVFFLLNCTYYNLF